MVNDKMVNVMKRIYFQPEVNVATIAMQSNLLAGSAGGGGKSMNMSNIPTDDQW